MLIDHAKLSIDQFYLGPFVLIKLLIDQFELVIPQHITILFLPILDSPQQLLNHTTPDTTHIL